MMREGQQFTLGLASLAGAVISPATAVCISFALLDIYFEEWARVYYSTIYVVCALLCFALDQDLAPKFFTRSVGVLCLLASGLSACMGSIHGQGSTGVRVLTFSFLGLIMALTTVLSILLLIFVINDVLRDRKGTPPTGVQRPYDGSSTRERRLSWLYMVAVIQGLFFGLVVGLLEHHKQRPHILALPHADPLLVLPVSALLGAIAGFHHEKLRQDSLNLFVREEEQREMGESILDNTLLSSA